MKLNLSLSKGFSNHRSGWKYCLDSLRSYHSTSGIFVEDFIERSFSWELGHNKNIPYNFPWVGFLHNPHNMPKFFDYIHSPQAIFARPVFQESLRNCRAIVVLSDYLGEWVSGQVEVPVISVKHPTGTGPLWDMRTFLQKRPRTLAQVGYWLRDISSIALVDIPANYQKICLPSNRKSFDTIVSAQRLSGSISHTEFDRRWSSIKILDYLSNKEYDDIYSTSIIYLDLYDSSANNAIVEAMVRGTPVLTRPHPAVVEYLGGGYPLYFNDKKDCYDLLLNTDRIIEAHEYLMNLDKKWIDGRYFAAKVMDSLKGVL